MPQAKLVDVFKCQVYNGRTFQTLYKTLFVSRHFRNKCIARISPAAQQIVAAVSVTFRYKSVDIIYSHVVVTLS